MKKSTAMKKSVASGRFVTKPLGRGKAEKFSKVEGMVVSSKSANTLRTLKARGLEGDALRSAISGTFTMKKVK